MQFSKWGEEDFIQYLSTQFPKTGAIVGIGDDCAVIPESPDLSWLVTTDALVEGIHFMIDQISPLDLGYKTIAVNVSDIAAMGSSAKYAFLSVAFPKELKADWVKQFVQGIKEACIRFEVLLLGGDTVGSLRDVFINLTLIGQASPEKIKYRHQAKVGDIIAVTGHLGDSGGGLKALQEKLAITDAIQPLINAHFRPEVNPEVGLWLASKEAVHAMMDLSDGLNCDLPKVLKQSSTGAIVDIDKIPVSMALAGLCRTQDWDAIALALTGGEDYCLMLTIAAEAFSSIQKAFEKEFGKSLFEIGRITDSPNELIYQKQGKRLITNFNNYNHFQ